MALTNDSKQLLLQALSTMLDRVMAASSGKTIQTMQIDPVLGTLMVTYVDDPSNPVDLGRVVGRDGDDGISVLDLQLYQDPEDDNQVFLQTTLSNGVILRTRDSLSGYHGKSLADVYLANNELHFVLDDGLGTELTPIPVSGLEAISITGAKIVAGDLIFEMSNGTEINSGVVQDLQGRGITEVKLEDGQLKVAFTDDPLTFTPVGALDGVASMALVDGVLVWRKSSAPTADIELGAIVSIENVFIEDGELKFTTNQKDTGGQPVILSAGAIADMKGDQGVGIQSVAIADNQMQITLTDNQVLTVPVDGLTPIHVTGARYDSGADEVFFTLSDGSEVSSGIKEDLRGAGVTSVALTDDGTLQFFYSNAPTTPVAVGTIQYIVDYKVENGKVMVTYNTDRTTPVEVGTMLGITQMVTDKGKFVVTYTDGSTQEVGSARALVRFSVDDAFNLVAEFTDETTQTIGQLPQGDQGVGFNGATIDLASGDLILSTTDGQTMNAGQVRMNLDNMIGSIKNFVAEADQTEYMVAHSGEALVWLNGQLLADSAINLDQQDRIVWNTPLTAGDLVSIIAFAPTGTVITGRGIRDITQPTAGVYEVELENGQKFELNTITEIPIEDLPPGIKSMVISPTGNLMVTLTDEKLIDAGLVNQSNNITAARVDASGNLILTLTDETEINAGSVMSNLAITDAEIVNGDLIITMNSGGQFNAGPTGVYPTAATIDIETGHLKITLSNADVLDAGAVVNPLMGTWFEFTAEVNQTDFPLNHGGHIPVVYANSALLSKASLDLTDPLVLKLTTPRNLGDVIHGFLMSAGTYLPGDVRGVEEAADETFYGKRAGEAGFFPIGSTKVAIPFDFVADPGQSVFLNVPHNGEIELFIDGVLKHSGFDLSIVNRVTLTQPLVGGEEVRINVLSAPAPMGSLLPTSYAVITNEVYENGGTNVVNSWQQRQLNNKRIDTIGITLQQNRMVLPAGTYYVRGWSAFHAVGGNAIRLYNVTDGKTLLNGESTFHENSGRTPVDGYFTLDKPSAVLLNYIASRRVATFGLGRVGDGTINAAATQRMLGVPAVLSKLEFWKL